jgi:uncharacterized cupin superfamily protein|tara:strand:+ start:1782 stop:2141 length:360 start_codon:yes stop_codon:yes gene_type:complete
MISIENILSLLSTQIPPEVVMPGTEKILSGQPQQNIWNVYSSADGKMHTGIWDCQAGAWQVSYSEDEVCIILAGESILTDLNGAQKTVQAGDQFVIPAGFKGTWQVPSYCKKVYVIYEA